MIQRWRRTLAALLLLIAVGAGVALLVVSSSGAEFLAGSLSRLLGRRVELASLELRFGSSLEVELGGLEIYGDDGEPDFSVVRARGRQSWPRILTGRVMPRSWFLEAPVLRIHGASQPGGSALPPIPPVELNVVEGSVIWIRGGPAGDAEELRIEQLHLSATQAPLRHGVVGSAMGRVTRAGDTLARFAVDFDGWLDHAELRGNVEHILLSAFEVAELSPRSGLASGRFSLMVDDADLAGSVDLDIRNFELVIPNLHGPIAPEEFTIVADLSWRDDAVRVNLRPFRMDDVALRGEVSVGRGERPQLRAAIDFDAFEPGREGGRLNVLRLVGLRHQSWADVDSRVESGWIEDLRLELDLPLDRAVDTVSFRRRTLPEETRVFARLRDAVYRPAPDASPLERMSGTIELTGNHLRISDVHIWHEGSRLPVIDVDIEGMHVFSHLPPEERRIPEGPGVPIPGLATAFASFEAEPGTPDPILSLSDAWIGYGPFLLPFRNASGVLRFPRGLLLVENAHGVLGGAPARLNARWDQIGDTLDVDIEYEDGLAPPASDPGSAWASGHFESELISLGDWPLEVVAGDFSVTGSTVSVRDVTAYLEGGAVQTDGTMSLAEEEAAPFGFSVELVRADGAGIVQILELEDGTLTGEVDAHGTIAGRLSPERLFLEDAQVRLHTECHGGTLGNLPARMLIARLATPLGWTSVFTGRELPLERMTADIEIENGILRTENFVLESPEARALAAGEIDVLSDDLHTDMVMALLFLQTVDQVLERVPLVGRWILGQDKSLVALYIHMEGPWEDPDGTVMPPSSVATATDWAGRVIGGGVRRVRDLLTRPPPVPNDPTGSGGPQAAPETNGASKEGKRGGDGASARQDPEP